MNKVENRVCARQFATIIKILSKEKEKAAFDFKDLLYFSSVSNH